MGTSRCDIQEWDRIKLSAVELGAGGALSVSEKTDVAGGVHVHADFAQSRYSSGLWYDCKVFKHLFNFGWRASANYTATFAKRTQVQQVDVRLGGQLNMLLFTWPEINIGPAYQHVKVRDQEAMHVLGFRVGTRLVIPLGDPVKPHMPRVTLEVGAVIGHDFTNDAKAISGQASVNVYVPFHID